MWRWHTGGTKARVSKGGDAGVRECGSAGVRVWYTEASGRALWTWVSGSLCAAALGHVCRHVLRHYWIEVDGELSCDPVPL